jgi:hypothetical protein
MFKRPLVMLLMTSALFLNCNNSNPVDSRFAPKITWQPQSQVVLQGNTAAFSVSATGDPAPTFQWQKTGVSLPGETDSIFIIPAAAFADTGTYSVVVSNSQGAVTSASVILVVYTLTIQPQTDTVFVDSPFTFTAAVAGIPGPTYQWRLNGFDIAGATSLTYSKDSATVDDAGMYRLIVSGATNDVYSDPVPLVVNP